VGILRAFVHFGRSSAIIILCLFSSVFAYSGWSGTAKRFMNGHPFAMILLLFLIIASSNVFCTASTTIMLAPVADAYISWDYPNTNYGTETKLRVGEKASAGYMPYLKFDLSAIPSGCAVFSAKLHLLYCATGYIANSFR
jgi:hypothetical protein